MEVARQFDTANDDFKVVEDRTGAGTCSAFNQWTKRDEYQ
jgi:hypothetical protein